MSLATGSGKTVIFTQLIDRVKPSSPTAIQTLILVHRRELVEQAARHCANAYPAKSIDIEMGNLHASGNADITVASVRSLNSVDRMMKFNPDFYKLILVDEAHHIVASSYMDVLRHFRVVEGDKELHSPVLVGVSATLSRFDGLRLSDAIDHVVYHKDYVDMIGEKWLSDVIFTTVQSKADISRVKTASSGDFQTSDLSKAVNTEQTNKITVQAWRHSAEGRKSTLVFCVDLDHLDGLTDEFRFQGIDARYITGNTSKTTRGERLDAFKNGDFPVLLNCGVFTEGTDIPNIDCVLLARPTRSRNLLVQMIGRGMRLHPGKDNCHIIDMVASLESGIVTTPTLFGLDPATLIKEANMDDMNKFREEPSLEHLNQGQPSESADLSQEVTFTHYDSVWDLIDDTSGERHIRGMSPFSWVRVDQDRYILSSSSGSYLTIELNPDGSPKYHAVVTRRLAASAEGTKRLKSPYMRPQQIATAETFSDIVRAADTFAQEKFVRQIVSHAASWRNASASEGQLKFLNNFRKPSNQLQWHDITRGKAGDMITKIKFGARGRYKQVAQQEKTERRKASKKLANERLKEREKVKVGRIIEREEELSSDIMPLVN